MSSGLVLAQVADPAGKQLFEGLVKSGVDPEHYEELGTERSDRITHVLPLPATTTVDDVSVGSFVLFYHGRNEYTWAAQVRAVEQSDSLVQDLLEEVDLAARDRGDFDDTYLILDIPFQVEIQSYDLHGLIGLDQDAITKFVTIEPDRLTPIVDDYGSVRDYILTNRTEPTIWIETTQLEGRPYKQEGGEYELGTAVFSKSESSDGRKIYETLREADVGDLVIHLLKERSEITGISLITSTLREDFEGPPDDSWPANARGGGYFRALARYQPFDEPIGLYDDLLDDPEYRPRLQRIYEEHDGLFYDKNRELRQGGYFTRCPVELTQLLIVEAPDLLSKLHDRYYDLPFPDSVDMYDSVGETVTDIRIRLAYTDSGAGWFRDQLMTTVVESLTNTLAKLSLGVELTREEAVYCGLLADTYDANTERFNSLADDLGIGRLNQLAPGKTLFLVLFRVLQQRIGVRTNMTSETVQIILNENYTVETPRPTLVDPDEVEPLPEADKPARADDIARQLRQAGQMVFYGPPGTSKTYTAQQFAKWWLHQQPDVEPDTSHLTTVTFHPSFTYEDFLEGLSAEVTEENTVAYNHEAGVFKEMAERAFLAYDETPEDESAPRYVLIIDEINRGNLAKIFGETMTALEYDKRLDQPNETVVSLAHTGTQFTVPPNLYLIGTMNTADRSIALVDTALRRRFRFLSFPPDFESLYSTDSVPFNSQADVEAAVTGGVGDAEHLLALSILAVQQFNNEIIESPDLGKGKQIGHSYFFGIDEPNDIVDTWRFEILPLLEEYYFGQFDRIQSDLFGGQGDALLNYVSEQIRSFDATDLETTLSRLVAVES